MEDELHTQIWPTELRVSADRKDLKVEFNDGVSAALPAEFLRVNSPSAEVQGHSAAQKILVSGKQEVQIISVKPIGNYAVRIGFDDMHDTGIFTWVYLHEIWTAKTTMWDDYLQQLSDKGLSRSR